MEPLEENSCSVIQYHKGSEKEKNHDDKTETFVSNGTDPENINILDNQELSSINCEQTEPAQVTKDVEVGTAALTAGNEDRGETEMEVEPELNIEKELEVSDFKVEEEDEKKVDKEEIPIDIKLETKELIISDNETIIKKEVKDEKLEDLKVEMESLTSEEGTTEEVSLETTKKRGRKRKLEVANGGDESQAACSSQSTEEVKDVIEYDDEDEDEEEIETKPRRRGRCKKNPDIIPPHLSSDIALGYKILLKFLETPQFSGFHKPFSGANTEENQVTCLNQIKKKFEDNSYKRIADFVNDVREMLTNIYESRNSAVIKRALRLEQVLEQKIAQLPNYLRPQCALLLPPDEVNSNHNKIRINKGGGFVSLLLEKAEKRRTEKDKEKRKLLAEERKQLKEEQDKDVQEWEKNVLMKDHEEEIKSLWELPVIGHFIHLCVDILNIGEVAQYEVERMLLMPQCSDTLDLIMTALLSNSLVRAKLDRTPSMPYSIWAPLVRTRVISWYRAWHREGRNAQKIFEEIGVEPEFWQVLGPDRNPLDYFYFHELTFVQRVWILKTLCDVDFVRKKTVYDNIRAQTLDELNAVNLGVDRHGNRYIQLKQFCGPDMRIYRQSSELNGEISPSELIESSEGFEYRDGPITVDKVFKDIWEMEDKRDAKGKKKKLTKNIKKVRNTTSKASVEDVPKKNLRQSARAKRKTYVDWSDSDQSDTDLATLKNRLRGSDSDTLYKPFSDKEFISLSVFRLPRDKVNKPTPKKSSYISRKQEELSRSDSLSSEKGIKGQDKKESKTGFEEEASDSLDLKQMQDMQMDFEKNFQIDELNEDEFDLEGKITDFKLGKDNKEKFTVKNLENLKMVLKKGANLEDDSGRTDPDSSEPSSIEEKVEPNKSSLEEQCNEIYKYHVPEHLMPDSCKFYLVVDSVDGLRQLISKFASHENDLEIISRSTKSRRNNQSGSSCEVQLIERLQNLLVELEPWELDLLKSSRSSREKLYKEYMNFINRPPDFVHPNEAYWMKVYEEPAPVTTASSSTTTTTTTTTAVSSTLSGVEKLSDGGSGVAETTDVVTPQNAIIEELGPRKRTRVTRLQIKLDEEDELDEELGDEELIESSESDDNWEMPVSAKKRAKKEATSKTSKGPKGKGSGRKQKGSPAEKIEKQTCTTEKSTQSPSADKARKALFWGPRSSDPSEDLNWETNRQKILEKHNSPTKKVLFRGDEIYTEMTELENALSKPPATGAPTTGATSASPKRFITQIPGNKKPYYSSAQLKAMENQAKQNKTGDEVQVIQQKSMGRNNVPIKPAMKTASTQLNAELIDISNEPGKPLIKVQYPVNRTIQMQADKRPQNVMNRMPQGQAANKVPIQQGNKIIRPMNPGQTAVMKINAPVNSIQQPVKTIQQVKKAGNQIPTAVQKIATPIQIQTVNQIQRIPGTNQIIQIQKPIGQVQEVQLATGQLQHKPISQLQQIHIQQGGQIQQIQIQHPTSQIQTQYVQQVIKTTAPSVGQTIRMQQPVMQVQTNKIPTIQQQVQVQTQTQQIQMQAAKIQGIQQNMQIAGGKMTPQQQQQPQQQQIILQQPQQLGKPGDGDLYLTDGTLLIKADSNFVQQFMQKDKVLTLNINEKLDFKKPLLIVKPKSDSVPGSSVSLPQTVNPNANVNQLQAGTVNQIQTGNVSHIQTANVSHIQTANVGQIQAANVAQMQAANVNQIQAATVNQIQTSNVVEPITSQPQNILVFNKPNPVQQTSVPTSVTNFMIPASYIVSDNSAVQQQVEQQNVTLVQQNPTYIIQQKPAVNKNPQPQIFKIINPQPMTSNQNIILSPANIKFGNQVIRTASKTVVAASEQQTKPASTLRFIRPQNVNTSHIIQNKISAVQTARGSVNNVIQMPSPRMDVPKTQNSVITSRIVTANTQTNIVSAPATFVQAGGLTGNINSQPVRFVANNSPGMRLMAKASPAKTPVITNASQGPGVLATNTRPVAGVGQPIRVQTVSLQPSMVRPAQNRLQVTPTKYVARTSTGLITNPIIIKLEDDEDEIRIVEEKTQGDNISFIVQPVTVDYLHGELSAKETSQGWKYVVKASDGQDVILTNEQVEERRAANNGCMK